jgi:hypothetical protein
MSINLITFIPILLLPIGQLFGQTKFEKEYRIKTRSVPNLAIEYVSQFGFTVKVKWFREESYTGKSIEAKVKQDKTRFSIEFDTIGNLQDIEIEIRSQEIAPMIMSKIRTQFGKDFAKHKINKIQRQFSGESQSIFNRLNGNSEDEAVFIKYEIIVKGKKDGKTSLYEYLFDRNGELEKRALIVFRNTDHLVY